MAGYPCRGIRTEKYLYIRNFEPGRWPAGVPSGATHPMNIHPDCDDGPTKQYLIENQNKPELKRYYNFSFGKRPAEELYDMHKDPDQLNNVAEDKQYSKIKKRLSSMLMAELRKTSDPRVTGGHQKFDEYPYRASYRLNQK